MTFHFYLNHRLLRWPPLYHVAHALHHRNVNTGPWTGISMHPLEHLIYFSLLLLWWVVPVHPVVVVLTGFYQGISPAVSHSGFDQVVLGGGTRVSAGDLFHGSFVPGCMV
ncbi:MAG: sterol desaturase family protein, partial [Gammaproteobacteria bacterium]|nr:sterol desaturase family protein [Gammaproteobacteria bacterium]